MNNDESYEGKHVTIAIKTWFHAAHLLEGAIYGKCQRLHGHSYKLIVKVTGPITSNGWVCNFKDLKAVVNRFVEERLDHNFLNEVIKVPTAENLACYIHSQLKPRIQQLVTLSSLRVMVFETENSFAYVED